MKKNCELFQISDWFGILPVFYAGEKRVIARFCLEVMKGARDGDKFCQHVFYSAGRFLGRSIVAVARKADEVSTLFKIVTGRLEYKILVSHLLGSAFSLFSMLRSPFKSSLSAVFLKASTCFGKVSYCKSNFVYDFSHYGLDIELATVLIC